MTQNIVKVESVESNPPLRSRCRAVALGSLASALGVASSVALLTMARDSCRRPGLAAGPADAIELCALMLAGGAVAWLTVLVVIATAGALPGSAGDWSRRRGALLAPVVAVRLTALLLGTAVLGSVAAPAWATGDATPVAVSSIATSSIATSSPGASAVTSPLLPSAPDTDGAGSVQPLPDPTFAPLSEPQYLPEPGWRPTRGDVNRPARSDISLLSSCPCAKAPAQLVVHRGDSLWQIAGRHLGPDATPSEIARAWPRWYAANRALIGDDPDLLLPGQVLSVPDAVGAGSDAEATDLAATDRAASR